MLLRCGARGTCFKLRLRSEQHTKHQAEFKAAGRKHARLQQVLHGLDTEHQQEEMLLRDEHSAARTRMDTATQADVAAIAATAQTRDVIATDATAAALDLAETRAATQHARARVHTLEGDRCSAGDTLAAALARTAAQEASAMRAQDARTAALLAWETERTSLNAPIAALDAALAGWEATGAQLASHTAAFEAALAVLETDARVSAQRAQHAHEQRSECVAATHQMRVRIDAATTASVADRAARDAADVARTTAQARHTAWQHDTRAAAMALRPATRKVLLTWLRALAASLVRGCVCLSVWGCSLLLRSEAQWSTVAPEGCHAVCCGEGSIGASSRVMCGM